MNIAALMKAYDAVMAVRDMTRRFKDSTPAPSDPAQPAPASAPAAPLEARLTNVVVAALKEAFDRDHARLELERAQLEEERRRSETALRLEMRRQAVDRELMRLRWLGGVALVGWISSVGFTVVRIAEMTGGARAVAALGWLLLLSALGLAFSAQARLTQAHDPDPEPVRRSAERQGGAALWLVIAGLAVVAGSLLL